jgi:hypothetical protein
VYGGDQPTGDRVRDFLRWCARHGITAEHMRGPREWSW